MKASSEIIYHKVELLHFLQGYEWFFKLSFLGEETH